MKWRNAYLLLYERKTPCEIVSDEEKESEKVVPVNKDEDIEMITTESGII